MSRNPTTYFEYTPKTIRESLEVIDQALAATKPTITLAQEKGKIWLDTTVPSWWGLSTTTRRRQFVNTYYSTWTGLFINNHRWKGENAKNVNEHQHHAFWSSLYDLYCNRNLMKRVKHLKEKLGATSISLCTQDRELLENALETASLYVDGSTSALLEYYLNNYDPVKDIVTVP